MRERKEFKKVEEHGWFGGVCGGIAYSLAIPVLWIRISFFLIVFFLTNPFFDYVGQFLFWFYLLAWAFAPDWDTDPNDYEERTA